MVYVYEVSQIIMVNTALPDLVYVTMAVSEYSLNSNYLCRSMLNSFEQSELLVSCSCNTAAA